MPVHPSAQARVDKKVYKLARRFLLATDGVTTELLDRHLSVPSKERPQTLAGVFQKLVFHAQNRHSLPNVIGGRIGGIENLSSILCGFQPKRVLTKYTDGGAERLLDDVVEQLLSDYPPRREARSHWPAFCRAILSGASFLSRFRDSDDFYSWVAFFDGDDRAR